MENKTFSIKNIENLQEICAKTIELLKEHEDGDFMYSQLMCLSDRIKDFINNPIVKNSGLL